MHDNACFALFCHFPLCCFTLVSLVFSQPFLSPKQELGTFTPENSHGLDSPATPQRPKPTFQEPADWRRHRISKVLRASWFARVASEPVMRAPGTCKPPGSGDLDMWPGWNLQQLGCLGLIYFISFFGEVSCEFRHGSEKEQCLRYPDYNLSDKYQSYNRLRKELGMYIDVFQSGHHCNTSILNMVGHLISQQWTLQDNLCAITHCNLIAASPAVPTISGCVDWQVLLAFQYALVRPQRGQPCLQRRCEISRCEESWHTYDLCWFIMIWS